MTSNKSAFPSWNYQVELVKIAKDQKYNNHGTLQAAFAFKDSNNVTEIVYYEIPVSEQHLRIKEYFSRIQLPTGQIY